MIYRAARSAGKRLIANRTFWRLFGVPLARRLPWLDQARYGAMREHLERTWLGDWRVRNGPFAGLRYPNLTSCGSALHAKIVGTYERELQPFFAGLLDRQRLPLIYDVGCAEGYYAVGIARRLPSARVVAFDISPDARTRCRQMADANGVSARVEIRERCRVDDLRAAPWAGGGLLVCDCEGAEADLFPPDLPARLACTHVVVELHQSLEIDGYARRLVHNFSISHCVSVVPALPESERIATGRSPFVESDDIHARTVAFEEYRTSGLAWLIATPRDQ